MLHNDRVRAHGRGGADERLAAVPERDVRAVALVVAAHGDGDVPLARVGVDEDEAGVCGAGDVAHGVEVVVVEDGADGDGGVDGLDVCGDGLERVNEVGEVGGSYKRCCVISKARREEQDSYRIPSP